MEPSISDQDILRTMILPDVCLCCLARNVKFVSLAKCKHTSILGYFFKIKFQCEDSVICYECHQQLNKIELFKVQIQESLALLWKKQKCSDMRPKKFQNLTFSSIYKTTNINNDTDVKLQHKLVQNESNSTNANSKQAECIDLTAEIEIEMSPDNDLEGVEQIELVTTDAIPKQAKYNNLTAEVSSNANLEKVQYYNWTTEIKVEETADCEPDMPLSEIKKEIKRKETTQQVLSEKCTRKRQSETLRARSSNKQLSTMLEFMERHRELALGQFKVAVPKQREKVDKLWATLTNLLNSVSGGSKKTLDKWKKVWADWKSKTMKSVLMKRRNAREEPPVKENTLTWSEQRMWAIVGRTAEGKARFKELEFDTRTSKQTRNVRNVIHSATERCTINKNDINVDIEPKVTPNVIPKNSKQLKCNDSMAEVSTHDNDLTAEVTPDTDLKQDENKYLTVEVSPDANLKQAQYSDFTAEVKVEESSDLEQEQCKYLTVEVSPDANLKQAQYSNFTAVVKVEECSDFESDMYLSDIRKDVKEKKKENVETLQHNSNFSENLRKNEFRVRSSCKQLATMLEFMERHRDFALGRLRGSDPDRAEVLWKRLADLLNSVGGPRTKPVDKWRKVWWDWKSKTKKRVLLSRRPLKGRSPADLKQLELRLWALIGPAEGDTSVQMPPLPGAVSDPPSVQQFESDVSEDETTPDERSSATKKAELKETRMRSSVQQIAMMIDFIERHGDPAHWKNKGRRWADQMWQKLVDTLNSVEGCNGTVEKWKKLWADWKFKTKKKVSLVHGGQGAPLTRLERRLWAAVGQEAVSEEHRELQQFTIPSQSTEGSHSWDVSSFKIEPDLD